MPYAYPLYVCLICTHRLDQARDGIQALFSMIAQLPELAPQVICMPYMYSLYVCLICMPYMYALYVCLICIPYMYALYVCLICMPYMYAQLPELAPQVPRPMSVPYEHAL
jgi:hypothetical protein